MLSGYFTGGGIVQRDDWTEGGIGPA
jgi:hypothetical protein